MKKNNVNHQPIERARYEKTPESSQTSQSAPVGSAQKLQGVFCNALDLH